jgi:hypothetical protein
MGIPGTARLAALAALLGAALLACTAPPESTAHGVSTAPPPPTSTTTSVSLPPRPHPLPLDKVNPCQVLSRDQRTQLSLDNPPSEYVDQELGHARACTMRGNGSGNVARLALVTNQGVEVWLDENAQVKAAPTQVAGWPALVVRTPGLDTACNVEVDVAPGQFLDVLFRDGGNATPAPQDTLCLGAQRVAEAAVTGLQRK